MKILVITQFYWPEPFRVHEICESFVDKGHEVTVVTTFPNYPEGNVYDGYDNSKLVNETINGVNVIRVKSAPRKKGVKNLALSYISYMFSANRYVSKLPKKFDVVYVYQMSPVLMVAPAMKYCRKNRKPYYLYCLDIWPESIRDVIGNEKSIVFKIIKYISCKLYRGADRIGITSKYFRQYLIDVCGVNGDKITYLPQHAGDVGYYPKSLDSDKIHFCFTGNIGELQRVDIIIKAAELIKENNEFVVDIVGTGSKYDELVNYVKERQLDDVIVFHGRHPIEMMPKFYRMADVCLLTLSGKTLSGKTIPGKLQGYMSAGKPIIASIDGDAVEVIREANCGIVVPPDDENALASAMQEFIKNSSKYCEWGKNARLYYEREYTLENHIKKLESHLIDVVGSINNRQQ